VVEGRFAARFDLDLACTTLERCVSGHDGFVLALVAVVTSGSVSPAKLRYVRPNRRRRLRVEDLCRDRVTTVMTLRPKPFSDDSSSATLQV